MITGGAAPLFRQHRLKPFPGQQTLLVNAPRPVRTTTPSRSHLAVAGCEQCQGAVLHQDIQDLRGTGPRYVGGWVGGVVMGERGGNGCCRCGDVDLYVR